MYKIDNYYNCTIFVINVRLMIHDGETYGVMRDRVTFYDSSVIPLSLDQLRKV